MNYDRYRCLQLFRLFQPEGGMEILEFLAVLCGKKRFPKRFEVRFVRTEDLAELAAVLTVYQSDQVGRANVVCDCLFARRMGNFPNHFVQGCVSQ